MIHTLVKCNYNNGLCYISTISLFSLSLWVSLCVCMYVRTYVHIYICIYLYYILLLWITVKKKTGVTWTHKQQYTLIANLITKMVRKWLMVGSHMVMLHSKMICNLVNSRQNDMRFYCIIKSAVQFQVHELFISGYFHLIFLSHSWPCIIESAEIEAIDQGGWLSWHSTLKAYDIIGLLNSQRIIYNAHTFWDKVSLGNPNWPV